MKLNLKTKSIYSDNGEFIKKLKCQYFITEADISLSRSIKLAGNCTYCKNEIYKTENLTDKELLSLVDKDPNICFLINKNQSNISKIEVGELLYFSNISGASTIECFDCAFETKSFVTNLRTKSNKPCQCQECGRIYENLVDQVCSHNNLSSDNPIFCKNCKSTNVKIGQLIIG